MARGNRPDCAYFIVLGISLAAFLLTMGGILTYVAFWPQSALAHYHHHHVLPRPLPNAASPELTSSGSPANEPRSSSNQDANEIPDSANYDYDTRQHLAFSIVGPLCLGLGLIALITVLIYAFKFDCDHEPEPNIAFLRLRSELSLNFEAERNKYELMIPNDKPDGRRKHETQSQRY